MKVAYNIQWDVDMDQVYERLDNMTAKKAAEALEMPFDTYANMTTEERHDYAFDSFHHHQALLNEFVGLPDEVKIPKNLTDDEAIADWLSDKYGYCLRGFDLKLVNNCRGRFL